VATGQTDPDLLPTLSDLRKMETDRKIDGDQLKTLGGMLVDVSNAKTDEFEYLGLQNDIYDIADLPSDTQSSAIKSMRKRIANVSAAGRLEIPHATALSNLMAKVKDKGFKTSSQVRARISLKRILGGVDVEFKLGGFDDDPQAAARIQHALNEYDDRIEEGEDPWELHSDLINRAQVELPTIKSIPRPMFAPTDLKLGGKKDLENWTKDDVEETRLNLVQALKENSIKSGAYNASMKYLSMIGVIINRNENLKRWEKASKGGGDEAKSLKSRSK